MNCSFKLVKLVILFKIYETNCINAKINPDVFLSLEELTEKYGYPLEVHSNVVTPDGYKLTMNRIPYGKNSTLSKRKRPIVLLMHGLSASGEIWTIGGPKYGLGYILADNGYDVWIGRARGTEFSRGHLHYNAETDNAYWMFSWHEMGYYDVPAMIDHILSETKQNNLTYIAHSQGTTLFFVMASTRPEYNNKVNLFVAFAPVAYLSNVKQPLARLMAENNRNIEKLFHTFGIYSLFPYRKLMWRNLSVLCSQNTLFETLCVQLLFYFTGYDIDDLNRPLVSVLFSKMPDDLSTMQFLHFLPIIKSGRFMHYNHGLVENLKRYGKTDPPDYNIRNVETPVILFYGLNDLILSEKDVDILTKELPNVLQKHLIPYKKFNHLDFFLGKHVNTYVHNLLLRWLRIYVS